MLNQDLVAQEIYPAVLVDIQRKESPCITMKLDERIILQYSHYVYAILMEKKSTMIILNPS